MVRRCFFTSAGWRIGGRVATAKTAAYSRVNIARCVAGALLFGLYLFHNVSWHFC